MSVATRAGLMVVAVFLEVANFIHLFLGRLLKEGSNNSLKSLPLQVILEIKAVLPLVVSACRFFAFLLEEEEEEEEDLEEEEEALVLLTTF